VTYTQIQSVLWNPLADVQLVQYGSQLVVDFPRSHRGHIRLFDINGKVHLQDVFEPNEAIVLDISSLPLGIYIIETQEANGNVHIEKFLKE